ncbi:glycosyltransferase family 2 protein [Streptosporangium sp. NPDC000509]|uniref:glycosyltransferase family 2 protein n=1 Tax=Streptosporangium sp. NPDC000509 TaxID=3366186 RepID=UPI0036C087F9
MSSRQWYEVCPMLVTVLTPTFNRAGYLPELHASLLRQDMDLEWVVIDDGSTDDTEDVMEELARISPFPVRCQRQPNGGKHSAFNHGVSMARGELIAQIDSDDLLVPGGLRRLLDHWSDIGDNRRYAGVAGLCVDERGHVVGERFPRDMMDASWQEAVYRYSMAGDKPRMYRTDVLRAHPFPLKAGYVAESVVWRAIGRNYLTRHVNEQVVVCRMSAQNRLTRRPFAEIASGAVMQHGITLAEDIAWLRFRPVHFARAAVNFSRACFHRKEPVWRRSRGFDAVAARALSLGSIPLGWVFYRMDLLSSGS